MHNLVLLLALFFSNFVIVNATILHVGPGQPYATPAQAAAQAQPGDSILIHPHVYSGGNFISNLHGAPGQYIYFIGLDPANVIFQGGSQAIHFSQVSYIHLEGISITGQTANGINIDDGGTYDTPTHHIRLRACYFYDMGGTGNNDFLKMSGVDDFWLEACHFENGAAGGSGIDMVGCHNGIIQMCSFKSMGANAIQAKGGTQYISILQNIFEDAGLRSLNLGGNTDLAFFRPQDAPFEAADMNIYANVFTGSWAPIAYVGCVRVHVWNNTIILPQNWIIRILQEHVDPDRFVPCGDNSFVNNIIYYDASISTHVNIGPHTDPQSFLFAHNLWFRYTQPAQSTPGLPVMEINGIYGEDPSFVNYTVGDYRLSAGSPAIDTGMEGAFELDFDGQLVPQGDAPDMGAFEFPVALDLELLFFDVRHGDETTAEVEYAFSSSLTNYNVTLQRADHEMKWTAIDVQTFEGASSNRARIKDIIPQHGLFYYRLYVDAIDGFNMISPFRVLNFQQAQVWKLYPNPCRHYFHLQGSVDGQLMKVWNMQGHLIFQKTLPKNGEVSIEIDVENWLSGSYLIEIGEDLLFILVTR